MREELVGQLLAFAALGEQVGVDLDIASTVREDQVVGAAHGAEEVIGDRELVAVGRVFDSHGSAGGFGFRGVLLRQQRIGAAVSADLQSDLLAVDRAVDELNGVGCVRA